MFNRKDHEHLPDRELMILVLEILMALDLTKLNASIATLSGDVSTLIATVGTGSTSAADQAAVDGAAASLDALSAKVAAAMPPVTPPTT